MTVDEDTPVTQVFVKSDFRDTQALGNLVDA
jgi:hypothetical protein